MYQQLFEPLFRAVAQLNDRVFLGVVWRSLLLSLVAFAGLLAGSVWLVEQWAAQGGWLGWLVGLLGGVAVLLIAIWLYVPAALLIATFYVDRIAGAVERRYYPELPPPVGAPLAEQGWDGVVLALQVLALQVATLVASVLLPGIGLVLGYAVTGWAIGRGLFVGVAMRRMSQSGCVGAVSPALGRGGGAGDRAGAGEQLATAQSSGSGGRDRGDGPCVLQPVVGL